MNRFWIFAPWLMEVNSETLVKHCTLLNSADVFGARQPAGTTWTNFPTASLVLTMEEFNVDCFTWESYTFVSNRLRQAMALPSSAVQFFDIDASRSTSLVRANDYKIMNVANLADAIDISVQVPIMARALDGSEGIVGFGKSFPSTFRPTHEIFHDRVVLGHVFCTDALALRVLRAGCTDVRFFDPARFLFRPSDPFRTVRGIEQNSWDPLSKTFETRLIETIP